ncbi:hypothetical protein G1C98_0460 [Bifidobacterium sp. DSM 109960]|uniref:Uncharacterized protein n=1 Tax=Bifidobacterium erythrocebi TaxID=2675325 RepID=A0A7Y0EST1_9BIFI|nr:hypothetical protein [Bifidobacterium sp. DSM 109960]
MSIPRHALLLNYPVTANKLHQTTIKTLIHKLTPHRGTRLNKSRNVAKLRPISLTCGRFRVFDIAISLICGTYRAICRVRALEFQRSYFAYPGFGATDKRDSKTEGGKSATHRRDTRKTRNMTRSAMPNQPRHSTPQPGTVSTLSHGSYHYVDTTAAKTTANHAKRQMPIMHGHAPI